MAPQRGLRDRTTTICIGLLAGPHTRLPDESGADAGFRTDLVERALEDVNVETAQVWITRNGALSPGDTDFAWFAATRQAFGRLGREVAAFYVITRDGWIDLIHDEVTRIR
jgi:hypothetical protein